MRNTYPPAVPARPARARADSADHAVRCDPRVEAWAALARTPAFVALAERVVAQATIGPEDVVVDLGAGTGLVALQVAGQAGFVTAVDRSPAMLARLQAEARLRGIANVATVTADIRSLPVPDESASVVVSNYAFHHLDHAGKELALSEARRVLKPGGRLVIADMMFGLSLGKRDREIIASKLVAIGRRGPAGIWRIARNAGMIATGHWEHPEPPEAWLVMLADRRFADIGAELLGHEAGLVYARRPLKRAAT